MIGELLDTLKIGIMPSSKTIEQAAAWAKLQTITAREEEQNRLLQQMYFYETPPKVSVCSQVRAMSMESHRCNALLAELDLTTLQFDAFEAAHQLGKQALTNLVIFLVCKMGLVDVLCLSLPKLKRFLEQVEKGYRDVPYHNKVHVVDVVQRFHAITVNMALSPVERLAGYIAAAVHDYGHGGVTNSYLIATDNVIARRYNNRSPWENFHASQSLELLRSDDNCFIPHDMMHTFKQIVIHLVLATDMSVHVEMLRPSIRYAPLTLAIKCADVGHCAAPSHLHKRWAAAFMNELKLQGDLEKKAGLPETWIGMQESQLKFFDVIIVPMLTQLSDATPTTLVLRQQATNNRQFYS